ncbi:MAG: glycosyltransferase [Patescibacteria group bacterium]|jgi:cellulose synthase/poly-beta-1,6-N-acetylglucosamine synthase-like glycosyltransferase|nr:glycosyltransferase [Patescibacteria group bacterium]
MISIIITTYRESKTLEQTLRVILNKKINQAFEILVVAPDEESREVVNKFSIKYPQVKFIQDQGLGKPSALNLAFGKVQGDILILTDGDVVVESNGLEKLVQEFNNPKIGAVCGQPTSISDRKTMLGYWSHWLVNAAHQRRLKLSQQNKYLDCSGYLYAIRNKVVNEIPENVLSDDIYISQKIWQAGYQIVYRPEAKVRVKYPNTFSDWVKQKKRSAGGAKQKINQEKFKSNMRGFFNEAWHGFKLLFSFPKNLKEFSWTLLLFLARIYLWILILVDLKIKKKNFAEIWQRIESSK